MKTTVTLIALAASAALAQSQTTETPATAGKPETDKTNEAECAECVDMPPYVGSEAFEKMYMGSVLTISHTSDEIIGCSSITRVLNPERASPNPALGDSSLDWRSVAGTIWGHWGRMSC